MEGLLVDSAIIAAIISAVISIGFLVIREFLIEPKKWKKEAKRETLLKQINAYGELLSFLDAAKARRVAWKSTDVSQVTEKHTHLFLLPGHEIQFNKIFRENMSLLSSKIINLHISFIEKDTAYDFAEKRWKNDQGSWYQGLDLSEIHDIVKTEFNELRAKYEEITGNSFSQSYTNQKRNKINQ